MALNIKNEEAHRLVQELARLTGDNQTTAVTKAVQEKLSRIRGTGSADVAERLIQIGKDCASRLGEPYLSIDHGDLLYGPDGLPK